ncbi:MAG: cellulose binding domain-containing protein [Caldilineaceae bacterium]
MTFTILLLLVVAASIGYAPRTLAQDWGAFEAPCAVTYKVTGQWGAQFAAQIALTNLSAPLDGWTLGWVFPGGQRITQLANGEYAQNQAVVTVTNGAWNRALRSGQRTIIAFQANAGGAHPTEFVLNGAPCEFETVHSAPIFWRP